MSHASIVVSCRVQHRDGDVIETEIYSFENMKHYKGMIVYADGAHERHLSALKHSNRTRMVQRKTPSLIHRMAGLTARPRITVARTMLSIMIVPAAITVPFTVCSSLESVQMMDVTTMLRIATVTRTRMATPMICI